MKHGKMLKILVTLVLALFVTAGSVSAADKGDVRIAYVEWDCAAASTHVVKVALEEMGYNVEILPVAAAAMWQAVATGNVDAMVTAWLPVTHAAYMDRFEDDLVNLGPLVGGAKLGWAVPSYVTIDSIEELNAHADKFNGRVIGIDPGAGLMGLSEKAMEAYNLTDMELVEGSGTTMTAALDTAIKRDEWIVVTAWSPHWMFGVWDLKYLEDPKGILGEEEQIHTVVRKGLKEDMPEVYNFLDNFAYESPNQLQMIMAWNQESNADREETAKRFLEENKELFESWKQ